MTASTGFAAVLKATASAVASLGEMLGSSDCIEVLAAEFGHHLPPAANLAALDAKIGGLRTDLVALGTATEALDPGASQTALADAVLVVAAALAKVCRDVEGLASSPIPANLPPPLDSPPFWQELSENLLGHVIYEVMDEHAPRVLSVLRICGVAGAEQSDETGAQVLLASGIQWSKLEELLSDPLGLARETYGWNAELDQARFVDALGQLAFAFGLPSSPWPPESVVEQFWDLAALTDTGPTISSVSIPILSYDGSGSDLVQRALTLSAFGIPDASHRGHANGFAFLVQADAGLSTTIDLTPTVRLALAGDIEAGATVAIRPDGVAVATNTGAAFHGSLSAAVTAKPAQPWVLGDRAATRIETTRLAFTAKVEESSIGGEGHELSVQLDGDFTAYLDLGAGDSFVNALLGSATHQVPFTTGLVWSSRTGLHLLGGPGTGTGGAPRFATTIPLSIDLGGVLQLSSLTVAAGPAQPGAAIEALATGRLSLGPFTVTFKGIGIAAQIDAPAGGTGNLGPLDLKFGLSGPEAIGLVIQAAGVTGGGFLEFDPQTGRYVGVCELTLIGSVSVKAIGIITTRMPDGSKGFSLLILITAEGFTPVQLGMGFTLTGIGGLLALNRTVDADAVRDGLSDGILDSVLFVKDPVKNADRVITTLDKVFPIAKDRLVVGPLAEISWGTPTILTMRVAILLDLPMPIRAVILAALAVKLPRPQDPVVEIHVDAVGVIDLGKGQLALDASLHDSRILSFTLSGDLALRLDWGANPGFLLSVGGFHPRFTPPPGLRPLKRLALQLTSGDNPQVRFEAYLAITSNTLQMGAKASVKLEVAGFGVAGGGSFDALLQWSPFHLEVDLAAWVKITAGGATILALSLQLAVTGPQPWHLTGQAEFSILFFSVSVGVDLTLGSSASSTDPVEAVDVAGLIWEQVGVASAWEAVLPAGTTPGVTLLPGPPEADRVLAHPLAAVSVRQKVVPLGERITHLGARVPSGGARSYDLGLTLPPGVVNTPLTDLFAPAQFTDLSGEEKLSAPSFTSLHSGWLIAPASASSSGPTTPCLAVVDTFDVTDLDAAAAPGAPAAARVAVAARQGAWSR